MRCICCNRVLLRSEMERKLPDGKEDGMCNVCIRAGKYPENYHEFQLEHITDPMFSIFGSGFSQYSE